MKSIRRFLARRLDDIADACRFSAERLRYGKARSLAPPDARVRTIICFGERRD